MPKREKKAKLKEGLAEVVFNRMLEEELVLGERVWLREIKNMRGHCIVLRHNKLPLVGIHLDRFRMLKRKEI
jgi:hypothetical protein